MKEEGRKIKCNPVPELKKTNIARVYFRVVDGTSVHPSIIVTRMENFKSAADIKAKYGEVVFEDYSLADHAMFWNPSRQTVVFKKRNWFLRKTLYPLHLFNELIDEAKMCGVTLSKVIKSSKEERVIEI